MNKAQRGHDLGGGTPAVRTRELREGLLIGSAVGAGLSASIRSRCSLLTPSRPAAPAFVFDAADRV
ncbi:hypothetical protein [Streptomyces sp. cmx-4-9]|uniref:hypothetical protein n=1 Tax=Streptomyces sp. cmx-4-9 TaxID=2790941 RepID=UPI00397F90E9